MASVAATRIPPSHPWAHGRPPASNSPARSSESSSTRSTPAMSSSSSRSPSTSSARSATGPVQRTPGGGDIPYTGVTYRDRCRPTLTWSSSPGWVVPTNGGVILEVEQLVSGCPPNLHPQASVIAISVLPLGFPAGRAKMCASGLA